MKKWYLAKSNPQQENWLIDSLTRVPKLGQYLQVETRPVLVLTLAAVIVVTVLFWLPVIGIAIA